MNRKDLTWMLLFQGFCGALAGISFALISSRLIAGLIAGVGFLALGVFMISRTWVWPLKFKSFSFYLALVHVFVISLPMLVVRWQHPGTDFSKLSVWGILGPEFHKISTQFFVILVLGTAVDLIRALKAEKAMIRRTPNS